MRVAHLIHGLDPGGAEALLVDLARVAPGAGMSVAVLALTPARDDRYVTALRDLGVPVAELDLPTRWDPRAFGVALRRLRAWHPDVIHTHLKHADLVGAVASRRTGVPMVSTLHVIEDAGAPLARAKAGMAARARMRTARATLAVSDAQRRWYLRTFTPPEPDRVRTVPNGVADPRGDAAAARRRIRAELGCTPADVLVVQVAVARPGKGHAVLVDAVRTLAAPRRAGRVMLAVAGDGPLRTELAARAADLGDLVRFLGHRDDVPDLLAAGDIVAHPSEADALPTALLEALAAGRPIVATPVGGIPEIVTPGVGVLVPPGSPAALAVALAALAAVPARREALGAAARARFEAHFDARVWARRLNEIYTDVLSRPAPGPGAVAYGCGHG